MAIINPITSRNQLPKYTYFLVRSNSGNIHTNLPLQEYKMYVFTNPVTVNRGISILANSFTQEIVPISNEIFQIGTFLHAKYTNQTNQPLQFFYKDIDQVVIPVTSSRNENIVLANAKSNKI